MSSYLIRKNLQTSFKLWKYLRNTRLSSTAATHPSSKYATHNTVLGYTVKGIEDIPELNLTAMHLEHTATGAEHLHLACEDPNNLFGVMCRTPPTNSTGIPHILEHLSLCGSRRFPCRDPFFNMLNRSLATYMNAFTAPDLTMYAFSSQNPQDFHNLLNVYLDAVFYPILREKDFRQEGWRLEHKDVNDNTSPIILKGVVLNEMKGVYADPNQVYAEYLLRQLFPCNAYRHCFGGDPLVIPQLTWEELCRFHAKLYHPSNSRFITYGNIPLENHLEKIESLVLDNFQKIKIDTEVPDVKVWNEPREITIHNKFDPMAAAAEKQTIISESFVLDRITNTRENFALSILGVLLVDGPNSPFYQNLLESGIGPDYSPYTGFGGFLKQSVFSVGLRQIASKDTTLVKEVISKTFDDVINSGFPENQIKGVLHSVELSTKHRTSNFGLNCAMGVCSMWNNFGNPIAAFQVNDHVRWFSRQMEDNPHFLQDKVAQYFKHNTHKLTLTMSPLEEFEAEQQKKEKLILDSMLSNLSDSQKLQIYNEGLELSKHQQQMDASCLPTLQIEDVEITVDPTPLQFSSRSGIPLQLCSQPTNELVYFRAMVDASCLPPDSLPLLPLLCTVLTEMGAGSRNYKEFDEEAQLKTGGLSVSFHISEHHSDPMQFKKVVIFRSRCLQKNVDNMFSLWKDIFNDVHLNDLTRLTQLVQLTAAEATQGISHNGHRFALRRAAASLTPAAQLQEVTTGISQITYLKQLAEMENHKTLIEDLKNLADILLKNQNGQKMKCSINATPEFMADAVGSLELSFLKHLAFNPKSEYPKEIPFKPTANQKSHFVLPVPLNFVAQTVLTVPYAHKDFASLKIVAKLMSSKFLHKEIREKGGAYGSGASLSNGGHFMRHSYRDPNFSKSLSSFSAGVDWVLQGEYTDQDINEAKLGVFSDLDSPIPPGAKGSLFFSTGITDEMRNEFRSALFRSNRDNLIEATRRYLKTNECTGTALIGPENHTTSSDNSGWEVTSAKM